MPTYRNDSTERSYAVTDTDGLKAVVPPGQTVETYDKTVPADFTEVLATPAVMREISGEDVWTDTLVPKGQLNISVSGEFVGTVQLLRSNDGFVTQREVDTFTTSEEKTLTDTDPNFAYKIGVSLYTSGAVIVELS